MKQFIFFFGVIFFSAPAWASDVAVVWGQPDFDLEFVANTVVEHVDVHHKSKEQRFSTEIAAAVVRGGAKTISSIGVTSRNASATETNFVQGLREAAARSKIVLTTVGPLRGRAVCEVIREFRDTTVFVVSEHRTGGVCGSANVVKVFQFGRVLEEARIAGDLSNFATLYPALAGAHLVDAYRHERRPLLKQGLQK